jgi:glutamine amidotransferase
MNACIGILDLGVGNRTSVRFAFERLGCRTYGVAEPGAVEGAQRLVIPGVAHVGYLTRALDERGLREPLLRAIDRGVPLLGICAGFQLLYEGSDEAPNVRGLGVFSGTVRRLRAKRVQHVGWNRVEIDPGCEIAEAGWAYFVHGYAPQAQTPDAVAWSLHGSAFACVARRGNVLGTQFHPERSGAYGARLLQRFARLGQAVHAG